MRKLIIQRLLGIVPVLLLISVASFLLVKVAPGGPFASDRNVSPEIARNLEAKYHLDEPAWKQFLRYMGNLCRGDLGPSLKYRNHTVNDVIAQGLPVSILLGLSSYLFALGLGLSLGAFTALRRGSWQEHFGSLFSLLMVCIPGFVLGPALIMLFAVKWKLFPVALLESPWHLILPTITLGLFFAGKISRLFREGLRETLTSDFIRTARAKGAGERLILWRHCFKNAVLPVISYSGPLLADLFTGSFVVENIFQIPGIGVFMVNGATNRDYPMVVGLVLLYAVILLILNLLVDLAYGWLDPRVSYD